MIREYNVKLAKTLANNGLLQYVDTFIIDDNGLATIEAYNLDRKTYKLFARVFTRYCSRAIDSDNTLYVMI